MEESHRLLQGHLFERAPILGAVLDRDLRVVEANERFRRVFPDWRTRHCFELFLGRTSPCSTCHARTTLEDGRVRVVEVSLPILPGAAGRLVTRVAAISNSGTGGQDYAIWMGSSVEEAESLQRENELLFEHVPCYVVVLDRQLRIVRANRRMRETFGARAGEFCYAAYKQRDTPCESCPARQAIADGQEHTARQVGIGAGGQEIRYLTTAAPLTVAGSHGERHRTDYVIQMSVDLTEPGGSTAV